MVAQPLLPLVPQDRRTFGTLPTEKGQPNARGAHVLPHHVSGSAQGTAVSGNQRSYLAGLATGQELLVTCVPVLACMAVVLVLGDGAALQGKSQFRRAAVGFAGRMELWEQLQGPIVPSPCLSHTPGLPALPPPWPQVPGTQQNLVPGAAAGTRQRRWALLEDGQPDGCQCWPGGAGSGRGKLSAAIIPGATSPPSPVSPALRSTNPHIYQD